MRGVTGLLLVCAVLAVGVSSTSPTSRTRLIVADTVIAGIRLHAEAVVEPIPAGFPWAAEMLGVTEEAAKSYVRALKIKVGSTPVGVPLSGYSDLGNLSRMWFE